MALLVQPSPKRILLTLIVFLGIYGLLLPVWFRVSTPYAGVVAAAATRLFPIAGLTGSVRSVPGSSVSLLYTLPDVRTGGWGRCPQRLLNFPDLPLAAAGAAALGFLSFRRRGLALLVTMAVLFGFHLGLVLWSAKTLATLLGRPEISAAELNTTLPQAVQSANEFGDFSPILVLVTLALSGLWLSREPPPGDGRAAR